MLPYKVSKTQLYLQDKDVDLDELTELYDASVFQIETLPIRSYEKDFLVQMDLSIEMNLDQKTLARAGYTTLDVLSDVGGIQSIIMSFMGILLGIINYNHFENYMASRLYKAQRSAEGDAKEIQPTLFLNTFEWLHDLVPSFLKCRRCNKTRKMREMELAR